jgi:uncharacterized protein
VVAGNRNAPRIVLDTNVWLDLLVFGDPRVTVLRTALEAGAVAAMVDAEGRDEWLRVLRYPVLQLGTPQVEAHVAAFDAIACPWPVREVARILPRCADPDDQKFLRLACDTGAGWLLSRDRAVLALAKRCRRDGLFDILLPEAWSPERPAT